VYFSKLVADFRRFQSEANINSQKIKSYNIEAERFYQKAKNVAEEQLSPCNITKLSLYLNYACFCFEQLEDANRAILMIEDAMAEAIPLF
jgi:hypothetical protein